jgi:nucleotide-binding universal stress UspA family protein
MMYDTLVVALDLELDGDRALGVVRTLMRSSAVRVELVTVSSPGIPTATDRYELDSRVESLGHERTDWSILHDNDVAEALLGHMVHHDRGLLVMATSAKHPWHSRLVGSITGDVLSRADRPVLLVGPHVDWTDDPPFTTLVPCLVEGATPGQTVVAIEAWHRTFFGPSPYLAEVVGAVGNTETTLELERVAELLAAQHVPTIRQVVAGAEPISGLEALTRDLVGPVYAATSARYCDGRLHWHSTTQKLVHDAGSPVLVVPDRPEPLVSHAELTQATEAAERSTRAVRPLPVPDAWAVGL